MTTYPGPTKVLSANYVVTATNFAIADEDADVLEPEDIWRLARAVEEHTHDDERGLPIRRLDTVSTPADSGHVQVYADDFRWWADTTKVVRTAVSLDATQTLINKTIIAPIITDPTITGWANAPHNHLDAAGAGTLDGAAIATGFVGTGPLLRESGAPLTDATLVDAVVRDTLWWGARGGTETPAASLKITGVGRLRLDDHLAIGIDAPAWPTAYRTVMPGVAAVYGDTVGSAGGLRVNSFHDGVDSRALLTGPAVDVNLASGMFRVFTAASVAAGETQIFAQRFGVSPLGAATISPAPGEIALTWAGQGVLSISGITPVVGTVPGVNLILDPSGGYVHPPIPGFHNIGHPDNRFAAFYSTAGAINPSTVEAKADIAPLDPAACAQAVLETDWVSFSYKPPTLRVPEPTAATAYDASDSNEVKAEKKAARDEAEAGAKAAYAKMLVETKPARDQKGYVLGSAAHTTSDLYGLTDRKSASPGSDLAVTSCALQWALQQLQVLRTEVAALKASRA